MKTYISTIALALTLLFDPAALGAQPADSLRILFVGNSFTYFWNLPQVVSAMAHTQGKALVTRQSTVGGSKLEQHWKEERNTRTQELIKQGGWDYVVFNNHSMSSIETPESFFEYGEKFALRAREYGAEPVFYMTWAYHSNPLMLEPVAKAYRQLARSVDADAVPVGEVLQEVRKLRPDFDLFHDDKHPSPEGTYLIGLTFYKYFSGASVSDIPPRLTTTDKDGEKLYLSILLPEDAAFLKQVVDQFEFKTAQKPVK